MLHISKVISFPLVIRKKLIRFMWLVLNPFKITPSLRSISIGALISKTFFFNFIYIDKYRISRTNFPTRLEAGDYTISNAFCFISIPCFTVEISSCKEIRNFEHSAMSISFVHSHLSLAHSRDLPYDRRACGDQWQTTRQLFFYYCCCCYYYYYYYY